jgi:hypothetical protein
MSNTNQQLQQAYEYIRTGQKQQAVQILVPLLKTDKDNANAWWLLANAVDNRDQARQALENVLRLRPNDEKAQKMLEKFKPAPPPPPAPAVQDFSFDDDPFAAPAPKSSTASTSKFEDDFDPFADSAPAAKPAPAASKRVDDFDPFADSAPIAKRDDFDPFSDVDSAPSGRPVAQKGKRDVAVKKASGGTNPLVIILAVIGGLLVCGCAACFFLPTIAASVLTEEQMQQFGLGFYDQIMGAALNDPTFQAELAQNPELIGTLTAVREVFTDPNAFGTMAAEGGGFSGLTGGDPMPSNINIRGSVEPGQTVQGNVDTFVDDGWTISGSAGDRFILEVTASDTSLDSEVALYDASGAQVGYNDDITFGSNTNSRLEVTLPSSGQFTIGVSAVGSGGAYSLTVNRG